MSLRFSRVGAYSAPSAENDFMNDCLRMETSTEMPEGPELLSSSVDVSLDVCDDHSSFMQVRYTRARAFVCSFGCAMHLSTSIHVPLKYKF
jgi:hypothetical protein